MSVQARVTGPAVIFGSSFSACRAAGMLKPNTHAAPNASRRLAPMLTPASAFPRHSQTISG